MLSNNRVDSVEFIINFCTLMTAQEVDKLLNHSDQIDLSWLEGNEDLLPPSGGGGASTIDCQCRYDIYCGIFLSSDCASPSHGCNSNHNCGVMSTSLCKGVCPEIAD